MSRSYQEFMASKKKNSSVKKESYNEFIKRTDKSTISSGLSQKSREAYQRRKESDNTGSNFIKPDRNIYTEGAQRRTSNVETALMPQQARAYIDSYESVADNDDIRKELLKDIESQRNSGTMSSETADFLYDYYSRHANNQTALSIAPKDTVSFKEQEMKNKSDAIIDARQLADYRQSKKFYLDELINDSMLSSDDKKKKENKEKAKQEIADLLSEHVFALKKNSKTARDGLAQRKTEELMQKASNFRDLEENTAAKLNAANYESNLRNKTDEEIQAEITAIQSKPQPSAIEFANLMSLKQEQANRNPETIKMNILSENPAQRKALEEYALFGTTSYDNPHSKKAAAYLKSEGFTEDDIKKYSDKINRENIVREASNSATSFAEKHPVISSIISVASNQASSLKTLEDAINLVDNTFGDSKASGYAFEYVTEFTDTIRETVSKDMGTVGKLGYNAAMNIADMTAAFVIGSYATGNFGTSKTAKEALKSSQIAIEMIMGAQSAGRTVSQARDRGISEGKAFATGVVAGAIEIMTEKIGIDALLGSSANVIKDVIKSSFAEGSEEAISSVANTIVDFLLNADKSEIKLNFENYISQGYNKNGALAMAVVDAGIEAGESFIGGAVAGGVMGTAFSAPSLIENGIIKAETKIAEKNNQKSIKDAFSTETVGNEAVETIIHPLVKTETGGEFVAQKIEGVEHTTDGTVYTAKTGGGDIRSFKIEDIVEENQLSERTTELFKRAETKNTGEAAKLFINSYDGKNNGESLLEYDEAFDYFYTMGSAGMTAKRIAQSSPERASYLSEKAQRDIANLGAESRPVRTGLTDMRINARNDFRVETELKVIDGIAKEFGLEIIVCDDMVDTNGQYLKNSNRIVISANAEKGLITSTAGHEAYHVVKNDAPVEAERLKEYVLSALRDGGMDIEKTINEKYRPLYGDEYSTEELEEELVADSMFDVFSNEKAIKRYASQDMTFMQKIADIFDRIIKSIRTAIESLSVSHEEVKILNEQKEKLENIGNMLREGLAQAKTARDARQFSTKQTQKNTAEAVKYSLKESDVKAAQAIGRKSINDLSSSELNSIKQFAEKYWKQLGAKSPFFRAWFGDWRVNDSTPIVVANRQGDGRGLVKNYDTDWEINISRKVFTETESHTSPKNNIGKTYLPYIRDIIRNAVLLDSYGINPTKSENSVLMHSFYAVADIGNGSEVLKLYVEEMYNPTAKDTSRRAYQLQGIEKQQFAVTGSGKTLAVSKQTVAIKTVSDLFGFVKQNDKNFNPKPTSKVVNADGTPKIMYHGTQEQFTVFDKKKAKSSEFYGKGFYFTENDSHAGQYGDAMAVYLDVKNPLEPGKNSISKKQLRKFLEAVVENEDDYDIWNYGTDDISEIVDSIYKDDAFAVIQDVNATAIGDFAEAIRLFNEANNTQYDGVITPTETVVYEPTQIKSATDNIGTFDDKNPDIRYSIKRDINNKPFVEVNTNELDFSSGKSHAAVIAEFISDKFNNIITANGQQIRINSVTNSEWLHSPSAQKLLRKTPDAYYDKLSAITNADELLKVARQWIGEKLLHRRKDNIVEFARGIVDYRVSYNNYSADVIVAIKKDSSAVLYDLLNIKSKKITDASRGSNSKTVTSRQDTSAENSIHNQNLKVNTQNSANDELVYTEPAIYDDNGDVIPLSERFNDRQEDVRFSRKRDVATSKKKDYNKRSYYSEFDSLAMRWRNKADTEIGDRKVISRGEGIFSLLKATEDGYIEIATGNWTKVKELKAEHERAYEEATDEIYGNYESYGADEGRDIWNLFISEDGTDGFRNTGEIGTRGVQTNSSGSDEHSRGSHREKSVNHSDTKLSKSSDEYMHRLIEENKNFRALYGLLNDAWASGIRSNTELSSKDIKIVAKSILKEYSSKYNTDKLTKELTVLYDYMNNNVYVEGDNSLFNDFISVATGILNESKVTNDDLWQQYENVRSFLRDYSVYISPEQVTEIENQYGSYQQWRNGLMGKMLRITKSDTSAVALDSVWNELSDMAPEYFLSDTNPLEMPFMLSAFFESIAPRTYNPVENSNLSFEEQSAMLALELQQQFYKISRLQSKEQKFTDMVLRFEDSFKKKKTELYKQLSDDKKATIEEQRENYRQKLWEYREQRKASDRRRVNRNKIERDFRYLNRRLNKPNDKENIPTHLQGLIRAALNVISEISENNPESYSNVSREFDYNAIIRYKSEYQNFIKDPKNPPASFDAEIPDVLQTLADEVAESPLRMRDLDEWQSDTVARILANAKHIVRTEKEFHAENIRENTRTFSRKIFDELSQRPDYSITNTPDDASSWDKLKNKTDEIKYQLHKPVYIAEQLGKTGEKLMRNLFKSENIKGRLQTQWKEKIVRIKDECNYDTRWLTNEITLNLRSGKTTLTEERVMGLYATSKRKQGRYHLLNGGFSAYGIRGEGKKRANEYPPLTENDLKIIEKSLSSEQKKYVDTYVRFLSSEVAEERNKVSEKMFGYKKYNEQYYFPIKVNDSYYAATIGRPPTEATLKNQSSAKQTVEKAKNMVEIAEFSQSCAKHVMDSINYCSLVLPLEDIKKVINYKEELEKTGDDTQYTAEDIYTEEQKTMQAEIKRVIGPNAYAALLRLLNDTGSGVYNERKLTGITKFAARAKKAAVMANISVVVQQPCAVIRAGEIIEPKYFSALPKKSDIEDMYKHNGCAVIKDSGSFDVNMSASGAQWLDEYSASKEIKSEWSMKDKAKNAVKKTPQKIEEIGSYASNKADEITWAYIWCAAQNKIKDKYPDISEEQIKEKAANLFQDTILKTQVYDSQFSKCQALRDSDGLVAAVVQFKSEPLTSLSSLVHAVDVLKNAKPENKIEARHKALRSFGVVTAGILITNAVKAVVQGIRYDDEDESFWEKYLASFAGNIPGDAFGMLPYVGEFLNLWKGSGNTRIDLSGFEDLVSLINKIEKENVQPWEIISGVATVISTFSGIPVYTVMRDCKVFTERITKAIKASINGEEVFEPTTAEGVVAALKSEFDFLPGISAETSADKYERLIKDYLEGDKTDYQKVYNNLVEEKLETVKNEDKELSEEEARAEINKKIASQSKKLFKTSTIGRNEASRILEEFTEYDENKIFWELEESAAGDDETYSKYSRLEEDISSGKDLDKTVKYYTDHGTKTSAIRSAITDLFKEELTSGNLSRSEEEKLRERIIEAYVATGDTYKEANKKISKWYNE